LKSNVPKIVTLMALQICETFLDILACNIQGSYSLEQRSLKGSESLAWVSVQGLEMRLVLALGQKNGFKFFVKLGVTVENSSSTS